MEGFLAVAALVLLGVLFLRWLKSPIERPPSARPPNVDGATGLRSPVLERSEFVWPGPGDFDVEVVGESNYQAAIGVAAGVESGDPLLADLVPEDGNPHDSRAVRVDLLGRTVGYLSRDDARAFRRRLSSRKLTGKVTRCAAEITGGGQTRDGRKLYFGVRLDMRPFD